MKGSEESERSTRDFRLSSVEIDSLFRTGIQSPLINHNLVDSGWGELSQKIPDRPRYGQNGDGSGWSEGRTTDTSGGDSRSTFTSPSNSRGREIDPIFVCHSNT